VPYVPVVLKIRVETLNNRTSLLYSQKFTPPDKARNETSRYQLWRRRPVEVMPD
jgi:hypothetical protein